MTQYDLQEAVDTILAGAQKKNKILNDKEKCIVAYEVGHAGGGAAIPQCGYRRSPSCPARRVRWASPCRWRTATTSLMTKEEILDKIATFTGGRAAEELIFHSITTGASNDIEQATKMARALITRYGMTEDFDMVALGP